MFANARMYSVSPAAGEAWRALFLGVAQRAGEAVEVLDYPAPAPLPELWGRPDKAAVFMCGLPYSRLAPRPHLLAAPVPSPLEFGRRPQYWSEFVVRADSAHRSLEDTFGLTVAFTSIESQSGFAAPLRYLSQLRGQFGGRSEHAPLFGTVVAPQITPQGALAAVADGLADVAAIDSYALFLLRRHNPQLVARARVVARTEPRPIPPLVASQPHQSLASAFLSAHDESSLGGPMADLLLERFVVPDPAAYEVLRTEFESTLAYWRQHALAARIHPAFQPALT